MDAVALMDDVALFKSEGFMFTVTDNAEDKNEDPIKGFVCVIRSPKELPRDQGRFFVGPDCEDMLEAIRQSIDTFPKALLPRSIKKKRK